jgi:MFS family permease
VSRRPRQELAGVLLLGLAGAGLVLLAMRQNWAHVTTTIPRPLPASTAEVTGQALRPAADAFAIAALASLAAVLATRRRLRRITGIALAGLGAGIAAAVGASIPAADILAAAAGSAGPATGAGAGMAAGSVTAGPRAGAASALTGFPGHAELAALPWRAVAIAGALAVIAAGALTTWRAERLPVMSGRYDRPTRPAAAVPGQGPAGVAAIWESLSRGEDPTAGLEHRSGGPERLPGRDARGKNGNTATQTVAEPDTAQHPPPRDEKPG